VLVHEKRLFASHAPDVAKVLKIFLRKKTFTLTDSGAKKSLEVLMPMKDPKYLIRVKQSDNMDS